eukprot:1275988-Pleurochrysis_carterae.AAC.1
MSCREVQQVCGVPRVHLGYLVDKDAGVVKDEEGPKHTLQLARISRMLGGNTGYFSGEEYSIIVCMHSKQRKYFKFVWLSARVRL